MKYFKAVQVHVPHESITTISNQSDTHTGEVATSTYAITTTTMNNDVLQCWPVISNQTGGRVGCSLMVSVRMKPGLIRARATTPLSLATATPES